MTSESPCYTRPFLVRRFEERNIATSTAQQFPPDIEAVEAILKVGPLLFSGFGSPLGSPIN